MFMMSFNEKEVENETCSDFIHACAYLVCACACSGYACMYTVYVCTLVVHIHIITVCAYMLGPTNIILCPEHAVSLFFHLFFFFQYDRYALIFIFLGFVRIFE